MLRKSKTVYQHYLNLLEKWEPPVKYWPLWCAKKKSISDREKISLGAILTQRTSWHNAEIALKNLKINELLSLKKIASLNDLKKMTDLIRPAGFYQSKPKRIFDFSSLVVKGYSGLRNFVKEDLLFARNKILSLSGFGPETADTILLYVLDKPTFIVDGYTKSWVKKRNLTKDSSYENLKFFFEKNLPKSVKIYQDFHALIIFEEKKGKNIKMEKLNLQAENPELSTRG